MLSSTLSQKKPPPLPSLTSQPHQVLASELVPNSDIQQVHTHSQQICAHTRKHMLKMQSKVLICVCVSLSVCQVCKVAAYTYSAISQIKVDAKEELVVQFAIP